MKDPEALSAIEQSVEELSIHVDRIVAKGPVWLRQMVALARRNEGDLVRRALTVAVRVKRKILEEDR